MADDKKTIGPDVSAPTEAPERSGPAPNLSDTAAPASLGPEELTVEEQLILEHEGQAALFEMGEATELCEPYRLIAEAKGIKFKIELSSDAFVYLPEGRLKKAISNILSNAVNYTEAGQSISVVFDKNKLSVSNECSVLPPEQLQHIFEPFYRPDLAHSQATGGNGLGLYIVQTILDKLRLKYQFVPMPNDRGMSFTIQF